MILLLDLLYGLALLLGWPWLLWRRYTRGPGSIALRERLGNVPLRPVSAHCVWIHGVSLGEVNATRTIVAELHRRRPAAAVVISSTTQTGLARARELYPRLTVFRFPLDFSFVVRRVLRHTRPTVIVLMELEVWPNLLEIAQREGIPVLIANGRVTAERSVRRFDHPLLRRLTRRMFGRVRWVGAQEESYAERFRRLGVPSARVEVTGSVKYDAADVSDRIAGQNELAEAMTIDPRRPLWVCGSTGPGEEAIILDAYESVRREIAALQLAIIPRKPERFDEVAQLIARRGFACLRRSGKPPIVPPGAVTPTAIFLGDTLGELRKFYALATLVFVGRTLVPMGGSDLMEVAGLAKPILLGPHTENFVEAAALLADAGASLTVRTTAELASGVRRLLSATETGQQMGEAGQRAILSRRGATERTVSRIIELGEIAE